MKQKSQKFRDKLKESELLESVDVQSQNEDQGPPISDLQPDQVD